MTTTQIIRKGNDSPFAFKCTYCSGMRVTKGSKVIQFEDAKLRVCSYCVEATEYLRDRLPIVEEAEN
jgi:hypothetical protein